MGAVTVQQQSPAPVIQSNQQTRHQHQQQTSQVHATVQAHQNATAESIIIDSSQLQQNQQQNAPQVTIHSMSQTAQLTAAAISKNPQLLPFAPQLISAVEAVQQQSLNVTATDPDQKEQLVHQLQSLLQQEAMKLASLAESQQQKGIQNQQQQHTGGVEWHASQNTTSQIDHQSPRSQMGGSVPSPATHSVFSSQFQQHQGVHLQQQQPQQQQAQYLNSAPQVSSFPLSRQPSSSSQQQQVNQPPLQLPQQMSTSFANVETAQQTQLMNNSSANSNAVVNNSNNQSLTDQCYYQNQNQSAPLSSHTAATAVQSPQSLQQINQQTNSQQQSQISSNAQQMQQQHTHQHTQTALVPTVQQQPVTHQTQQVSNISQQQQQHQNLSQLQYQHIMLLQQQQQQQQPKQGEHLQNSTNLDQPPLSVGSGSGVHSTNISNFNEINSPYQSPPGGVSIGNINQQPTTFTQPHVSQARSVSQPSVTIPTCQNAHCGSANSGPSYIAYSQQGKVPSSAASSQDMYYSISQQNSTDFNSSSMDLTEPEMYRSQSTHNSTNKGVLKEMDATMFKEPYPVDNQQQCSDMTPPPQQSPRNSQYINQGLQQSVNDLISGQQHQTFQTSQQSNMNWEPSSTQRSSSVGVPQLSMSWETSSGSNSSNNGASTSMSNHPPPSMKSSTTDPFLSVGTLDPSSQSQKSSSVLDIQLASSSFQHDQNSQSGSFSSSDSHDFDFFSHIAQSPLCTVWSNDFFMTPSPAPAPAPEEPPARGSQVLKYLIEKRLIDAEHNNITGEVIESTLCALERHKPLTDITFHDLISMITGNKVASQ